MRKWSCVLTVIATLVVATQIFMIHIAMMHLENTPDGSGSKIELFQAFLHESVSPFEHSVSKEDKRTTAMSPIPQVDYPQLDKAINLTLREDDPELIHIVHTRFMQHQGNLTTLGLARLKQFTSFCLPTMTNQTTQDFLWIIKVDPLLEENEKSRAKVLEPLLETIRAQENNKNIYVVASNYNFNMEGHKGSWRDGQEGVELLHWNASVPVQAKVYTGDMDRLKRAYELREVLPVLETRLDADDGLNIRYLENVQDIALDRFVGPIEETSETLPKPKWLYWCILTQIEWHSEKYSNSATMGVANQTDSWELRNNEKTYYGNPDLGYVVPIANDNFCITPGLTVGYGVGTSGESVPRYMHTSLYSALQDKFKLCHVDKDKSSTHKGPCLERMGGVRKTVDGKTNYVIHALRSRTLTSAGMDGVGNSDFMGKNTSKATNSTSLARNDSNANTEETAQEPSRMEILLWKVLESNFGIDPSQVKQMQQFFMMNRLQIALENSLGQCSMGHSCKDKARERLKNILLAQNATLVRH